MRPVTRLLLAVAVVLATLAAIGAVHGPIAVGDSPVAGGELTALSVGVEVATLAPRAASATVRAVEHRVPGERHGLGLLAAYLFALMAPLAAPPRRRLALASAGRSSATRRHAVDLRGPPFLPL